jgi:hypothetical protein
MKKPNWSYKLDGRGMSSRATRFLNYHIPLEENRG